MSFADVPGQEQVKRFLRGNLRNGSVSHAYLFSGPRGSGKLAMARAFAQAIYCDTVRNALEVFDEQEDGKPIAEACGTCISCRRFLHHNIIDYKEITLLKDKKSIGVEQIRDLQEELKYRPEERRKKIYVIDEAHTLNLNSANSMLKYLEEPGTDQMAILLTPNERSIPATVLSRVQLVKFMPPNPHQLMAQLLEHRYEEELKLLALQLAGNVEDALELLAKDWFAEYRSLVIELVKHALQQPVSAVVLIQQRLGKWKADWKKQLDYLAQMLELLFRDMIYHACQQSPKALYIGQTEWLQTTSLTRELSFWLRCAQGALEMRRKRVVNTNWQMMLEQFFIQMKAR